MLSGGDLDGDLYNIIYDTRLIPRKTIPPANYPRVEAKELDRKVETEDIIDFFVTFMQQDQLGRIATTHQTIADQSEFGTLDQACLKLAHLHSVAVDYSKSGIAVRLLSDSSPIINSNSHTFTGRCLEHPQSPAGPARFHGPES